MREIRLLGSVLALLTGLLVCLGCFSIALSQNQTTETKSISELSWIAGDWQSAPGGKAQVDEHWTAAAGGSMLGMSRTVVGDKTAEFEYLRIEQRADGIYYVAHPKARCPGTD